jgi:hypothetical protein
LQYFLQSFAAALAVRASARISPVIAVRPECVIEFAIGKQPGIVGHHGAAKLEHQAAIKIEPNNVGFRFTRRVRHDSLAQTTIS